MKLHFHGAGRPGVGAVPTGLPSTLAASTGGDDVSANTATDAAAGVSVAIRARTWRPPATGVVDSTVTTGLATGAPRAGPER